MGRNLKIGIPRGLFWYYEPDAYKIFWETLGFEVVQSPPTNRRIFDDGLRFAHEELCLPAKALHGHVFLLRNRVDYLFIPRIVSRRISGKKRYGCPKFIGLPELIKNSVPDLPPIISVDISLTKGSLEQSFLELKGPLGLKEESIIHALEEMTKSKKGNGYYKHKNNNGSRIKIGVVGHPYLIYDSYLSCNILDKLSQLGIDYTTSAEVPNEIIESELKPEFDLFWIYERELIGATSYFANCRDYHGGLYCVSFGCGAGSIMGEMIQRKIMKDNEFPFFFLVMDENTSDAGLLTRLEAFCDMVKLRKR